MRLKLSTARNKLIFMTDDTDHVTGATGLTLNITASKDGADFASITPTVTDLGTGWYNLALTTTHTNTAGDLALHITATGADPTDVLWEVESNDQYTAFPQTGDNYSRIGAPAGASVSADIAAVKAQTGAIETDTQDIQTRLPAALVSGRMDSSVGAMAADTLTASALAADAVAEIQSGLATSSELATVAGYIDTEVAAIKAKTDSLTFTVAGQVDANIQYVNDVQVQGNGESGTEWGPA